MGGPLGPRADRGRGQRPSPRHDPAEGGERHFRKLRVVVAKLGRRGVGGARLRRSGARRRAGQASPRQHISSGGDIDHLPELPEVRENLLPVRKGIHAKQRCEVPDRRRRLKRDGHAPRGAAGRGGHPLFHHLQGHFLGEPSRDSYRRLITVRHPSSWTGASSPPAQAFQPLQGGRRQSSSRPWPGAAAPATSSRGPAESTP